MNTNKKWNEHSDEYLGKVFRWHIEILNYVDVSDEYDDIEDMITRYETNKQKIVKNRFASKT